MITTIQVNNARDLKAFIDFPHQLYEGDPCYVPALYLSEKYLLTKHPFHQHSEIVLFLAYRDTQLVGRVAAILNNNYNRFHGEADGFFGFYESINDIETAGTLISTAEKWLKTRGVKSIIGPVNPSTNEICGYLVEGKIEPPAVMMPYNMPYYDQLFKELGFTKKTDLLAYIIDTSDFKDKPVKMLHVLSERLQSKGIVIRKVRTKNFSKEIAEAMSVYNQAWDKNLGFVPMSDAEFAQMAKDVKMILDTDFCLIAEHEGKTVGFALCIPDINQIQIKINKGRLFPFGILKLLLGKKSISKVRVLALGVTEPYRKMGIEAVFYGKLLQTAVIKGIKEAEASWILEDNEMMNRALENMNAKVYKRYRIVEKLFA